VRKIFGHDYSTLKKYVASKSEKEELGNVRVATNDEALSSFDNKTVLRIINYVLDGNEGVGIIGYTSTELRERRQSRVSPILIAGELCRVATSDYRKDWSLECPSGIAGSGIFSGVDAILEQLVSLPSASSPKAMLQVRNVHVDSLTAITTFLASS